MAPSEKTLKKVDSQLREQAKKKNMSKEKTDDNDTQQQPEKRRVEKTSVSQKMSVGNAQREPHHIGIRED